MFSAQSAVSFMLIRTFDDIWFGSFRVGERLWISGRNARGEPNSGTTNARQKRAAPGRPFYASTANLSSFRPTRQIFFLLRRELVDLNAQRVQLQAGHPLVQVLRNRIDLFLQALMIFHQILD